MRAFASQNNDASVDKSPLEDLADVNVLYYGNSATVEESGFNSQSTLFITTDIDAESFAKLNPNGMHTTFSAAVIMGCFAGVAQDALMGLPRAHV